MTCWWWIRHGPTHADGLIGWTDLPADLSDRAVLDRLADHLPDDALVISSDLSRASATADAIQGDRQRLPDSPRLREINFGAWEGRTHTEISATHPELARTYWSNPGDTAPPDGESWNQAALRVSRFVDEMNTRHAGADIIAVAHFGVILTQLQRAANMAPASALGFSIDNLSVTRLEFLNPGWRIKGVNHRP